MIGSLPFYMQGAFFKVLVGLSFDEIDEIFYPKNFKDKSPAEKAFKVFGYVLRVFTFSLSIFMIYHTRKKINQFEKEQRKIKNEQRKKKANQNNNDNDNNKENLNNSINDSKENEANSLY